MAENDEQKISSCENNGGNSNGDEVSLFSVKEEPLIFPYEHDDNHGGEDGWLPKPIEGLREIGPPPFLMKTFKMVDDPSTDLIISWSPTKASFVVWDPHKFSTGVLPKHFKHSNFSSFVRQLNTYSFRKINSDRWEFANEGFQKGKKHLLKLIKRRKPNSQNFQQQKSWLNSISHGVEAEFEKLKTDQNTLKMEVLKLRQQQENTQHYLASVKERLNTTETKQKHLTLFLIKFLKNPVFLQHLTKKMEKRQTLDSGEKILKKRRLSATNLEVDMKKAVDTGEIAISSSDANTVCSDIWTLFSSGGSRAENSSGTSSVDACSENFVLWEKFMDDDMINEDNEAVASKQQLDIDLELESLISSKSLEHVGCLASIA